MLSLYRLPHADPDEKILRIMRRDIFILFRKILLSLVMLVLPLVFFALAVNLFPNLMSGSIAHPLAVLGMSAYYLFVWLFSFFMFIDYYLDVWIVTNERIIDVQQKGFFSRTIAEQRLSRVQDVTSEVEGVWPTVFRFGNVHVQTAGEIQRFNFMQVPRPDDVRDFIIKLVERAQEEENSRPGAVGEAGMATRQNKERIDMQDGKK